jgi:hypothetical protein
VFDVDVETRRGEGLDDAPTVLGEQDGPALVVLVQRDVDGLGTAHDLGGRDVGSAGRSVGRHQEILPDHLTPGGCSIAGPSC